MPASTLRFCQAWPCADIVYAVRDAEFICAIAQWCLENTFIVIIYHPWFLHSFWSFILDDPWGFKGVVDHITKTIWGALWISVLLTNENTKWEIVCNRKETPCPHSGKNSSMSTWYSQNPRTQGIRQDRWAVDASKRLEWTGKWEWERRWSTSKPK